MGYKTWKKQLPKGFNIRPDGSYYSHQEMKQMYQTVSSVSCTSLATLPSSGNIYPYPCLNLQGQEQEKEKAMGNDCDCCCEAPTDPWAASKYHLLERARDVKCDKRTEIGRHFGKEGEACPQTAEELVEKIMSGQYKISHEDHYPWNVLGNFIWGDPNRTLDAAGYNEAIDLLDKEFTDVRDDIKVLEPKDGLKAFRKFQEKSFH